MGLREGVLRILGGASREEINSLRHELEGLRAQQLNDSSKASTALVPIQKHGEEIERIKHALAELNRKMETESHSLKIEKTKEHEIILDVLREGHHLNWEEVKELLDYNGVPCSRSHAFQLFNSMIASNMVSCTPGVRNRMIYLKSASRVKS